MHELNSFVDSNMHYSQTMLLVFIATVRSKKETISQLCIVLDPHQLLKDKEVNDL